MPTSPFGRALAVLFMYLGINLLALPISVVGASFQREYERLHPQSNYDEDDGDECTERTQTPLINAEGEDIKQSLAALNDKVTLFMDVMMQMQKMAQAYWKQSPSGVHTSGLPAHFTVGC